MQKPDAQLGDVTPRHPYRNMVEPDHGFIDTMLDRSRIPPLDGAVPEPNDYYSLGMPKSLPHQRRDWTDRAYWLVAAVVAASVTGGLYVVISAILRAVPR
jgi:hypothetical protein